ncbi:MAG: haloacid dehalogenase type II [Chloroflexota bacterium]
MVTDVDFRQFEVVSFDCFGTLIDFEQGVQTALRPILARHGVEISDNELLETYGALKLPIERSSPFKPFRAVLLRTMDSIGQRFGFEPTPAERSALVDTISDWPPFPDTVESLARLGRHFRLVILSNIDDDLFEGSARQLQVPFGAVVTSQQVGSYKPALANFRFMLQRLGLPKERVLHAAQSLFHDIGPAREIGLTSVWINRRHDRPGFGGTPPGAAEPDVRVPDLRTLARLVEEQHATEP